MNSTFEDVRIAATESNSKITIGNDYMLAYDVDIRIGDSHVILDNVTKKSINAAQNVKIDNHVWVGSNVLILKGASIASNSIGATLSVVTKRYIKEVIILGGSPAMQIKENNICTREHIADLIIRHLSNYQKHITIKQPINLV